MAFFTNLGCFAYLWQLLLHKFSKIDVLISTLFSFNIQHLSLCLRGVDCYPKFHLKF